MSAGRAGRGLPTPIALALFGVSIACTPALIAGGLMHGFLATAARRREERLAQTTREYWHAEALRRVSAEHQRRTGGPFLWAVH